MRRPLLLVAVLVALSACLGTTAPARLAEQPRPSYRLLQLNLCLSGLADCRPGTRPSDTVDEAVHVITAADPDAVTIDEACSGDVDRIARRTGYDPRFAVVAYEGAPLPCRNPDGRGVFGDAVLTRDLIVGSQDAAYGAQDPLEERRWICAATAGGVTVCGTHLETRRNASTRAVNDAQCAELRRVLGAVAARGRTVAAGDLNRTSSCAPAGMTTYTDAAGTQAPGIQQAYLTGDLREARATTLPMAHTDHDALLVTGSR
jgi:endonuclease/exonuclease/phosphatase family metal-dependent hydrolase